MKEITAIIRRSKLDITKKVLTLLGYPAMTIQSVEGRGKQFGLIQEIDPQIETVAAAGEKLIPTPATYALEHSLPRSIQYVPKRMLSIVVPDEATEKVVEAIITVNRTGRYGDGRIFVSPIEEATRIRTGEKGDEAVI